MRSRPAGNTARQTFQELSPQWWVHLKYSLQFLQALKRMCQPEADGGSGVLSSWLPKSQTVGVVASEEGGGTSDLKRKASGRRWSRWKWSLASAHRGIIQPLLRTKQYRGPAAPIFNNFGFPSNFCLFVLKVPFSLPGWRLAAHSD